MGEIANFSEIGGKSERGEKCIIASEGRTPLPGTLKSWLTQATGVGRTPWGERGPLGPIGLLTLLGEDWSPPGKRPRNSYRTKSGWTMSGRT